MRYHFITDAFMNKANRVVWFCLILLSLAACQKPPSQIGVGADFENIDAKIKLKYQDAKNKSNAKIRLRMQKDSLIWASITGTAGVEGFRALIRQDSVLMIDRLNKEYLREDFAALQEILKFPLDYPMLQALILGNMPLPNYTEEQVTKEDDLLKIRQQEGNIQIDNFINPKTNKLQKLELLDLKNKQELKITYQKYQKVQKLNLPKTTLTLIEYRNLETGENAKIEVNLDYQKIEVNKEGMRYPFSIPSKYKAKE